jgi:hypothetical protein
VNSPSVPVSSSSARDGDVRHSTRRTHGARHGAARKPAQLMWRKRTGSADVAEVFSIPRHRTKRDPLDFSSGGFSFQPSMDGCVTRPPPGFFI